MSEASRGVIGACLLDGDRMIPLAVTRGVTAAWFEAPAEVALWEAMEGMWRKQTSIDMILVKEEVRRKNPDVGKTIGNEIEVIVEGTPTAAHGEYYVDVLRVQMVQRGMTGIWTTAREAMKEDPTLALDQMIQELRALQEHGLGRLEVNKRELLEKKIADWREVARQRFVVGNSRYCVGTPLPWACMNSVFNGLRPGLHVLGARTSVGKTVFALNCSQFWCEMGIPHAFVTLDMPDVELLTRYVSSQARVSLRKLEWGANHEELEKAEAQIGVIDQACMHMTHEPQIERLRGWLNMAVNRWGIRAVVIDYIQLVRMKGDRRMRAFERVCEAVQMLKEMANSMGLPFLLLAQLSRETDKAERENVYAEPRLSDLGDSSEIEKAAASVTLMYRDQIVEQGWYDQPPICLAYGDEKLAQHLRAIWLKVEKNQQGLGGVKRPFIMYPHQFILRPGCYECRKGIVEEMTDPLTKKVRKVLNMAPAFARVRDDWRRLDEDETLRGLGGLGEREYKEGE